jgi:hypothetical protein
MSIFEILGELAYGKCEIKEEEHGYSNRRNCDPDNIHRLLYLVDDNQQGASRQGKKKRTERASGAE